MQKLVLICGLLIGLLQATAVFANDNIAGKNIMQTRMFRSGIASTAGDADMIHLIHISNIHQCSRQANNNDLVITDHSFYNFIKAVFVYLNTSRSICCNNCPEHLYPSHNFW